MSNVPTDAELQAQADERGAVFVNESKLAASIKKVDFYVHPDSQLTICIVTLLNGYTVTGESACADPKMFNAEIGEKFAFAAAERAIWPLLGYALKEELFKAGVPGDFKGRVELEAKELEQKLEKLEAFINGQSAFSSLSQDQQNDLLEQKVAMTEYLGILRRRLAR